MAEVKLSFAEKDVLIELASIAMGNASAALSNMIGGRTVDLKTPVVNIVPQKELSRLVGGPKKLVVGSYVVVKGDVSGNAVSVFPKEGAFLLIDLRENKKLGTTQTIEEKYQKGINEVGAAVISAYLNALTALLGLKTSCTTPKFFSTFGESVTDFIVVGLKEAEETFLVNSFSTSFELGPEVKGEFMFMLVLKPVDALLKAIQSKLGGPKEDSNEKN